MSVDSWSNSLARWMQVGCGNLYELRVRFRCKTRKELPIFQQSTAVYQYDAEEDNWKLCHTRVSMKHNNCKTLSS